jgi:two-component system, sensor histidine kinase RegB
MSTRLPANMTHPYPEAELGVLRLRTLVRLRWLAVVGQTAAVAGVYFLLGFPLPLGLCLTAIALSAWLNIFLSIRWRKSVRLLPSYAGVLLAYDVFQLAVLLYLTGGLENPFSFLFLVPVTISATSLPLKWTLWLGATAFVCATFLAVRHLPLPWTPNAPLVLPDAYIAGMWAAIICGVVFSAIYARRIADEAPCRRPKWCSPASRGCRRWMGLPPPPPTSSGHRWRPSRWSPRS